jgi:nucleotide-binding universal stress UspA family protein
VNWAVAEIDRLDEGAARAEAADVRLDLQLATRTRLVGAHAAYVLSVVRPYDRFPGLAPDDPQGFRREVRAEQEARRRNAARRLARAVEPLLAAGLGATTEVRTGDPAAEILAAPNEREADLAVVGVSR